MTQLTNQPDYTAIAATVLRFGRFRRRWRCLEGLGRLVVVAVGALLVWFLADWLIGLPGWVLFGSFVAIAGAGIWIAAWHVLRPAVRRVRLKPEALAIEGLHGKLDNRIIGSLELGAEVAEAEQSGKPLGYAPFLVTELVSQTARTLQESDVRALINRKRAKRYLGGAGGIAVAAVLCAVFAGDAIIGRAERLQQVYAGILDSFFPIELRVQPGNKAVVRGRPVSLEVEVLGGRQNRVTLVTRAKTAKEETYTLLPLAGRKAASSAGRKAALRAAHKVTPDETFEYRFEYARRKSPSYTIRVGDLPLLTAINYELIYPPYTGQPPRAIVGRVPRLKALMGTSIMVSFAASTNLHPDRCTVQWQDGTRQALPVTGRFGHFSFTVSKPDKATLSLTGEYGPGFEMENPVSFEVIPEPDRSPTVTLGLRKRELTLMPDQLASFALPWTAEDDFGVAEVKLDYKIEPLDKFLVDSGTRKGAVSRKYDPPQDMIKDVFSAVFKDAQPPIKPGEKITITVTAVDNNTESETGPGQGVSVPVEIIVVAQDLSTFALGDFQFLDRQAAMMLGQLRSTKRNTDLLVSPKKTIRTQKELAVERLELKTNVAKEALVPDTEDEAGRYFLGLSGGKNASTEK